MTESRENLSCLMDGELDRRGRRFLLRRLAGDSELKASWNRMHMVRACIQGDALAGADFASRVAAAIEAESTPKRNVSSRLLRPAAGTAIAASVAVMALIGFNASVMDSSDGTTQLSGEVQSFVSQPTSLDRDFVQPPVPVSFSEDRQSRQAQRHRLSSYVMRHHQAAGSTGFVSWVPIVADMNEQQLPVMTVDSSHPDSNHQEANP
ncbi:MAG TPA: sigma-E factor negative regulatory protein [Wenzhouxiangella sp.]|nr:sigma-E factor negative regulatory protein [Wenzhouxiangella sp.]